MTAVSVIGGGNRRKPVFCISHSVRHVCFVMHGETLSITLLEKPLLYFFNIVLILTIHSDKFADVLCLCLLHSTAYIQI